MYYQNYEDYMKNVLGAGYMPEYINSQRQVYPYNYYIPTSTYTMQMEAKPNNVPFDISNNNSLPTNTSAKATMRNNLITNSETSNNIDVVRIKKMYPEIYNLLNPMIEKTLNDNKSKEITEELVESMTKQIYEAIEEDMSVKQVSTVSASNLDNRNRQIVQSTKQQNQNVVSRSERRPGNPTLRDLIRILLINKILNNIGANRPIERPPMRPQEMPNVRPPMPGPIPMPRMEYPVMNYFNTPYPEDEYIS